MVGMLPKHNQKIEVHNTNVTGFGKTHQLRTKLIIQKNVIE